MSKLVLIRQKMTLDSWDYFETKTDVWFFGDDQGYRFFCRQLLRAIQAKQNIHLDILKENPNSMRAVILPARDTRRTKALLKFVERFVWLDGNPNMELVIIGNAQGYKYLAAQVAALARSKQQDQSDHLHFDDSVDNAIVPRSVALNIRAPLQRWNTEDYGEFADLLTSKNEDFLPKDIAYRLKSKEDYCEITCGESDILRL